MLPAMGKRSSMPSPKVQGAVRASESSRAAREVAKRTADLTTMLGDDETAFALAMADALRDILVFEQRSARV